MSAELTGSLATSPSEDVPALLAACRERVLEREGIGMFVALHDSRPGAGLRVRDEVALTEGATLAGLFDHYRDGLVGEPGDAATAADPTGARGLINILVVLSDRHLRAPDQGGAA